MRAYDEGASPDRPRRLAEGRSAGYACFEEKADAAFAAAALAAARYDTHVQYTGAWDCWLVEARRRSWPGWKVLRNDGTIR